MDKSKYPANWKAISHRIRFERAKGKCEECGVAHGAVGARGLDDNWYDYPDFDSMNSDQGYAVFGEYPKIIKIVLTTAHLDHNPANNDESNLKALCQRCHLRHDAKQHAAKAAETRRKKRDAATGQMSLAL